VGSSNWEVILVPGHSPGHIALYENSLKILLKENEAGVVGEYKITWKNQSAKRLDTKELKANEPELFEKYAKQTETRVFRVSKNKGGNNGE